MKILVAPDKFKGSLIAEEVCDAMVKGIKQYDPEIEVTPFPMADGGEGTARLLSYHNQAKWVLCKVLDPLFREIEAGYGLDKANNRAFIDMASASGLGLLKKQEQNPLLTSTYGTGQLIADAVGKGVKHVVLGIGGSATNDGGMGAATALGYKFLDGRGNEVKPIGKYLGSVTKVDGANIRQGLANVKIEVACDVDNPLLGPEGATYVYGPQKGAVKGGLDLLEGGMKGFASVVNDKFNDPKDQLPGAGAAGGLGFGCLHFLSARLVSGISLFMDYSGFMDSLKGIDLVITGEGKIDTQTLQGKVVKGVSESAKYLGIPVAAVCGILKVGESQLKNLGLSRVVSMVSDNTTKEEAMRDAKKYVRQLSFQLVKEYVEACS